MNSFMYNNVTVPRFNISENEVTIVASITRLSSRFLRNWIVES